MSSKIEKLGYDWITAEADEVNIASDYYCETRDVFQARLDRMTDDLGSYAI